MDSSNKDKDAKKISFGATPKKDAKDEDLREVGGAYNRNTPSGRKTASEQAAEKARFAEYQKNKAAGFQGDDNGGGKGKGRMDDDDGEDRRERSGVQLDSGENFDG
ncbi:hypothetical protein MMC10_001727 [Thelotrema lepadinum]|nr:hypothetical protein [Thelotrema lepadinum]